MVLVIAVNPIDINHLVATNVCPIPAASASTDCTIDHRQISTKYKFCKKETGFGFSLAASAIDRHVFVANDVCLIPPTNTGVSLIARELYVLLTNRMRPLQQQKLLNSLGFFGGVGEGILIADDTIFRLLCLSVAPSQKSQMYVLQLLQLLQKSFTVCNCR